jgi:predicted dehydrogenase
MVRARVRFGCSEACNSSKIQTSVDRQAGVPLLTGHHRWHNPMFQCAKAEIDSGRLGQIVSVHGMFWLIKPDDYFDVAWRREKGAGPVFLNLIHDVDLLRYLCGDVVAVQAAQSNRLRGNAVEETAVIILHFASGSLGTVNVSDTIQSPWSWEFTAGENPPTVIRRRRVIRSAARGHRWLFRNSIYGITQARPAGGRRSSASGWVRERRPARPADHQFLWGYRGTAEPVVSGREGLKTLRVIDAVKRAAETGDLVSV